VVDGGRRSRALRACLRLPGRGRARVLAGHPWLFANELREPVPEALAGEGCALRDARGRFLGSGIANPRSAIAWRRYSREPREFDARFLREAIAAAVARRAPEALRRLVFSESDDLPGLVVDHYEDLLVGQIGTLALERRQALVEEILGELLAPGEIVWRNDFPARRREGLALGVATRSGKPAEPRFVRVGAVELWLDAMAGQKTGLYLDQRREYARVAAHAPGRRVLDAFCYSGGFALHCAAAGAESVLAVEASETAVAAARRAAERSALGPKVEFRVANAFDFFGAERSRAFDLVVLDPPPFARSKQTLDRALRGYKEIHLRALQRLAPGGILATYACSHHVGHEALLGVIGSAAHDARRAVRVLEHCPQPPDHPVLPGMPESEYLRGFVLAVD
jgi:23S rRNA (cytosine1962-C5)-methyltransferase